MTKACSIFLIAAAALVIADSVTAAEVRKTPKNNSQKLVSAGVKKKTVVKKKTAAKKPAEKTVSTAAGKDKKGDLNLKYVQWDVHMLGVDTPEKIAAVRSSVKRTPVIALVSYSGINEKVLKGDIEYVYGPRQNRGMHDTYQISEVMQIAAALGVKVKIKVYLAGNHAQIAEAFKLAGQSADIVITYYSFWNLIKPMQEAVAANPKTLYISPYVEVRNLRTRLAFQGGARHPDGSGLRNFITAIPLSRRQPAGKLLIPSCRDANDIETVNFVAPSSYASSRGETCPSAGVTAVVAAYVFAASEEKLPAEKVIEIMLRNTSLPEKQMLALRDFSPSAVTQLQKDLEQLKTPDANGIRRLESEGVLNLWNIYQDIAAKK